MKTGSAALILALALGACADNPLAVPAIQNQDLSNRTAQAAPDVLAPELQAAPKPPGSGLVLNSLTGVALPLIPIPLGDIVIDEAVITNLRLVEDVAGNIKIGRASCRERV